MCVCVCVCACVFACVYIKPLQMEINHFIFTYVLLRWILDSGAASKNLNRFTFMTFFVDQNVFGNIIL